MIVDDWESLLTAWSEELLSDEEITADLPKDVIQSRWLGYAPASDVQLKQTEQRLGRSLPPSYRTFLQTTNGWRMTGYFVYQLRRTEEIEWYRAENQEAIQSIIEVY